MSSWNHIYETWKQASVPDIDIIPFEVSIHQDDYPWIHKKDKTQSFRQSNPITTTAYHLGFHLKGKDKELVAAFKLKAYCKQNAQYSDVHKYTFNCFSSFDEPTLGWTQNSRIVLPYYELPSDFPIRHRYGASINEVVDSAIAAWTAISKEWAMLYIPSWMDYTDEKYIEYQGLQNKLDDEWQYKEYLRLKAKFEQ